MRILAAILLVMAALAAGVAIGRERARKMLRLQHLVAGPDRQAPELKEQTDMVERLLPRDLVYGLRLLGIATDVNTCGLFIVIGGLLAAIAWRYGGSLAAAALASAYLALALMTLKLLVARRVAELGALLPGFFDRVRQMLIIGNSLPNAFARSVHDAQPRLAAFFAPALWRMSNGVSCSESIRQSAEEMDLYEMRLFASAVATNMRFGGSLTHSLNNLVCYLRKRAAIERELRANTSQIRASAWALGLLPILVAGLIMVQNRDYARWFITTPAGKHMLLYCIFSQIVGACLMRWVVRTKF